MYQGLSNEVSLIHLLHTNIPNTKSYGAKASDLFSIFHLSLRCARYSHKLNTHFRLALTLIKHYKMSLLPYRTKVTILFYDMTIASHYNFVWIFFQVPIHEPNYIFLSMNPFLSFYHESILIFLS